MSQLKSKSKRRLRQAVEDSLVNGASVRDAAAEHGLSKSAVGRIRAAMGERFARLQAAQGGERQRILFEELAEISALTKWVVQQLVDSGAYALALKGIQRQERQLALMALLVGISGNGARDGGLVAMEKTGPDEWKPVIKPENRERLAQKLSEVWGLKLPLLPPPEEVQ